MKGLRLLALPDQGQRSVLVLVGGALIGREGLRLSRASEAAETINVAVGGALIGTEGLRLSKDPVIPSLKATLVRGTLIGTEGLRRWSYLSVSGQNSGYARVGGTPDR